MYSPASDSDSSSSSSSTLYSSWSPSSSKTNSPVHAASLVDPAMHSPELLKLVDVELSRPVIEYVVDNVSETVEYALSRSGVTLSRGRSSRRGKFTKMVSAVLSRAEVSVATVLVALVYVSRARPHLSIALEDWALERVFLGALVTASKYTQDSTLRNVHWALCTGVFGKGDIGRIEREFLEVLDWELGISESDVLAHHEGIMQAAFGLESPQVVHAPAPLKKECRRSSKSPARCCPGLEPSSPHSSVGSLSPPTPVSHALYPDDVPMDVEEDVYSPIPVAKRPRHHSRSGRRVRVAA
ncbi:hypothetical protein FB45DRAFT_522921 [Roridomyces roridus]|uniref:Cyclin N-terminal domain-containing protein n=1 Tax=Roridomyces roridus TaxID=1738132 RepID=A0AAD7BXL1_9AGAR|nr:hypothetical protein FB45DRAFT_522921 [Roridomyces roridus]